MDLLERYLQAIGQYLPAETRDDVLAELRANLLEQIDARAEDLARPLTEADISEILRAHGKPEVVALRYLPQRSLIGPTVFPFYTLTLSRVLPFVVLISFIANAIEFAVSRHGSVAQALVNAATGLGTSLLLTAAIITGVFATIEWAATGKKWNVDWSAWDPAKLPILQITKPLDTPPRSTVKRTIDLIVHCLWMAYVLWVPSHPFWIMGPGVFYLDSLNVTLAPIWHPFYALFVVLLVIQLVLKLSAFAPGSDRWTALGKLGTDFLGLIAVGMLASASVYFVASGPAANLVKITEVNHLMGIAFRIVFVFAIIGFAKDVWPYVKRWAPKERLAF